MGRSPRTTAYVVAAWMALTAAVDARAKPVAVAHRDVLQAAPGVPQRVSWDGEAGRTVRPAGRYAFRVAAAGMAVAARAPAVGPAAFDFLTDRFPILGRHAFGTGAAAYGGPRGHQGQDTFAACGTPLVAARGGVVEFSGYHARAGHYLVIHNAGATTDYVYMHLRKAALVKAGERVFAGQPIGAVGDSGDADGCHLHFEIWTAPGWYSGGHPVNPLPALRAWDRSAAAALRQGPRRRSSARSSSR